MNETSFKTPKLLITDYYDSLIHQIDLYTDKLLENNDKANEIYNRKKNSKPDENQGKNEDEDEDIDDSEANFCDPYRDPYKEEYEISGNEVEIGETEMKLGEYLNACRMKSIELIRQVQEDNLKSYNEFDKEKLRIERDSIDDEAIERLREQLFATKFCFLINCDNSPDSFKLYTIVVDFYLNSKRIKLIEYET